MEITYLLLLLAVGGSISQSALQIEPSPRFRPVNTDKHIAPVSPLYRLNDIWIPSSYAVEIKVVLDNLPTGEQPYTARSRVEIEFAVTQRITTITLHANLLTDLAFRLTNEAEQDIPLSPYSNDTDIDKHFVHIPLVSGDLEPGVTYKLHAESLATVFRDGRTSALYLSNYMTESGEPKLMAATQMEAYHLRQLFPCFDEPDLKATFTLELIYEAKYKAIANGEQIGEPVPEPGLVGWVRSKFTTTVKMPTYLFAFTIGEFEHVNADAGLFSKPVRVWSTPDHIRNGYGNYSVNLTAKLSSFFDTFFNTTYPMEKVDSSAVTHKSSAMENWGLILYRTDLLMYSPRVSLETSKNAIASIVSHEVAHQNFGNLVTCNWWSEIWLNEGFATYLSYMGVDAVAPEFRHGEWQLNDALQPALAYDSGPDSHPLRNSGLTPEEIDSYFSTITYEKGASINRMIEGFLTKETFQKGLIRYLEAKKFLGVEQDDLFVHLQQAAIEDGRVSTFPPGASVKTILDTWTLQKGHPLVRVSVHNVHGDVLISQERYSDTDSPNLWYVPITVVTQDSPPLNNHVPTLWLSSNQTTATYDNFPGKWIMLNADATGFYRVLYDAELTSLIQQQLRSDPSRISPLSRTQLLDDYFNLAYKGYLNIETAMDLTTYFGQEDSFTAWEVVFSQFRNLHKFMETAQERDTFTKYFLPKIDLALRRLGLENEGLVGADEIFRMKLIDWACSLNHPACREYAQELYFMWNETKINPIQVDIQPTIFCTIVANEGLPAYIFVAERYVEINILQEEALKTRLLHGLACTQDERILQNFLEWTLEGPESGLAPTHFIPLIARVGMNSKGRSLVIQFLNDNLDAIVEKLGGGNVNVVVTILNSLVPQLSTQQELNELVLFIANHSTKLNELSPSDLALINRAVNEVRSNINWMSQWGQQILVWMDANSDDGQVTSSTTGERTSTTGQATSPTTQDPPTTTNASNNKFACGVTMMAAFLVLLTQRTLI